MVRISSLFSVNWVMSIIVHSNLQWIQLISFAAEQKVGSCDDGETTTKTRIAYWHLLFLFSSSHHHFNHTKRQGSSCCFPITTSCSNSKEVFELVTRRFELALLLRRRTLHNHSFTTITTTRQQRVFAAFCFVVCNCVVPFCVIEYQHEKSFFLLSPFNHHHVRRRDLLPTIIIIAFT